MILLVYPLVTIPASIDDYVLHELKIFSQAAWLYRFRLSDKMVYLKLQDVLNSVQLLDHNLDCR